MHKLGTLVTTTLAAAALMSACAVDSADPVGEPNGSTEQAYCSNVEGTNAMFAALAAAMGTELHRFELTNDFELYRGMYNQEMLRITQQSRSLCTNNCRNIDAILSLQDPRNDQIFVFKDGTKLNSWTFAARLVAGYRAQKSCMDRARNGDRNGCSTEWHYLEKVSVRPATCGGVDYGLDMYKFKVTKANMYGQELSPEQPLFNPDTLQRKLLWTDPDQNLPATGNPYLQFRVLPGGVELELDPSRGISEDLQAPGTCGTTSLTYSPHEDANDRCCSVSGSRNTVYKRYVLPGSTNFVGWHKCQPRP